MKTVTSRLSIPKLLVPMSATRARIDLEVLYWRGIQCVQNSQSWKNSEPISQKRTGQHSRNSLTGLTVGQAVFMQRIRVSQGKLNEYRHHVMKLYYNNFIVSCTCNQMFDRTALSIREQPY